MDEEERRVGHVVVPATPAAVSPAAFPEVALPDGAGVFFAVTFAIAAPTRISRPSETPAVTLPTVVCAPTRATDRGATAATSRDRRRLAPRVPARP